MPDDRYHHQSPLWALVSGAESIMPPTRREETLSADDLTVTVHASAVLAALILPLGLTADSTEGVAAAALAMACIRATRGTHLTYRRIRRRADGEHPTEPADLR
ncbi:hypothetical protein AB0D83_36540 [Streptomyces decoyicus]|uniref:hypothetical protein n=1 Tax=Streptomyces decoyicus TaxID=249567 RepID=UPI0033DE19BD